MAGSPKGASAAAASCRCVQRAVELRRFGQHRDGGRAAPRIVGDSTQPVLAPVTQFPAAGERSLSSAMTSKPARQAEPRRRPACARRAPRGPRTTPARFASRTRASLDWPSHPGIRSCAPSPRRIPAAAAASRCARPLSRPAAAVSMPSSMVARGRRCAGQSPLCSSSAVAMGAALAALENVAQRGQVAAASPPARSPGGAGREPQFARVDFEPDECRPAHVECQEGADGGRLVPAGRAMNHPGALGVHSGKGLGDQCAPPRHRRRR